MQKHKPRPSVLASHRGPSRRFAKVLDISERTTISRAKTSKLRNQSLSDDRDERSITEINMCLFKVNLP